MTLSSSIVCTHLCVVCLSVVAHAVEVCLRKPSCARGCMCAGFFLASHWVGISPFVLQLISVNAAEGAQPSNFIFGLPALRLNRCHSQLLCCSLCCRGTWRPWVYIQAQTRPPAAKKRPSVDSSRSRWIEIRWSIANTSVSLRRTCDLHSSNCNYFSKQ